MNPRAERLTDVFGDALELPAPERDAFVGTTCADDPALRDEILELLRVRRLHIDSGAAFRPARRGSGCGSAGSGCAGAAPPTPPPPSSGVLAGRYRLHDVLGTGGSGTVVRAQDVLTGAEVAVKFVAARAESQERAFLREAAALRRARAPGVVRFLAEGDEGVHAWLVMERVDGEPFPGPGIAPGDWRTVCRRACALLEALRGIHDAGVVHRDLKPDNVLVRPDGTVCIVDLGLAEDRTDRRRKLQPGPLIGTLGFVAPERIAGSRATVASDLWAVGVMIAAALASAGSPDEGPEPRTRPIEFAEPVPGHVQAAIRALLARNPRKRPASAEDARRRFRPPPDPRTPELPHLGPTDAIDAVVAAACAGRSIDVVGPPGSGRSYVLRRARARLEDLGFVVRTLDGAGDTRAAGRRARRASRPATARTTSAARTWTISRPVRIRRSARPPSDAPAPADERGVPGIEVTPGPGCVAGPPPIGVVLFADDFDDAPEHVRRAVRAFRARQESCVRRAGTGSAGTGSAGTGSAGTGDDADGGGRQAAAHAHGGGVSVVRVTRRPGRCRVETRPLTAAEIRPLVAAPDRIFHTRDRAAAALCAASDGLCGALAEAIRRWCGSGIATWDGRLRVDPASLERIPELRGAMPRRRTLAGRDGPPTHRRARPPSLDDLLESARSKLAAGRAPDALDAASRAAERSRGGSGDDARRYGAALELVARCAISAGTPGAIDVALYHAEMAPQATAECEGWSSILRAAEAWLHGEPARALDLARLAAAAGSPSQAREAWVVAVAAARGQPRPVRREVLHEAAGWARAHRSRDTRALLSAWVAWLRYDDHRFGAAHGLQSRAARLTVNPRSRVTYLCNAAIAAIETGAYVRAEASAQQGRDAAAALSDTVNGARTEWLLRQVAYRTASADAEDDELLDAAGGLSASATRGLIEFGEAAVAWRADRTSRGGSLARRAADTFRRCGDAVLFALATGLASECGAAEAPEFRDAAAAALAGRSPPPGVAAQLAALAASSGVIRALPPSMTYDALAWAAAAPRPAERRELLSPAEVAARLRAVEPAGV